MRVQYLAAMPALLLAAVASSLALRLTQSQHVGLGNVVATERLAFSEGKPAKDAAAAKASRKKAVPQQKYEHSEEELEAADYDD